MHGTARKWVLFFEGLLCIALVVLAAAFVLSSSFESSEDAYGQHSVAEAKGSFPINWPSGRGHAFSLGSMCFDEFLHLTLSPNDTYQVEFGRGKKTERMIVNSGKWAGVENATGEKTIVQRIPRHIVERGYDRIIVSVVNGDGEYGVADVKTLTADEAVKYRNGNYIDFEIKQLEMSISKKSLEQIEQKRREALRRGILLTADEDNVPARVKADGNVYRTRVRLKGDWTDHLSTDKWGVRIDVRGDECIFGMAKFSIHPPETRNWIWEPLIYEMYREQGGVALRYDFADVFVNGVYKGVFAVEEFMQKRVVENSLKREGPIVKIAEDLMWERAVFFAGDPAAGDFIDSSVEVFSNKKTAGSSHLALYASYAITSMNRLLNKTAQVEDIFDVNLYARLHAILDLFGAAHGRVWHNMRHYLNPVTGIMEPVPFDEMAFTNKGFLFTYPTPIVLDLFANPEHNRLYAKYLRIFADGLDDFLQRHESLIRRLETTIRRDVDDYVFSPEPLKARREAVYRVLDPTPPGFSVYHDRKYRSYCFSVRNDRGISVRILSLLSNGKPLFTESTESFPKELAPGEKLSLVIPESIAGNAPAFSLQYDTKLSQKESVQGKELETAFYVIGYAYGAPSEGENGIHAPVVRYLEQQKENTLLQFGVFTGDLVSSGTDDSFADFRRTLGRMGKHYYAVPGNHDRQIPGLFEKHFGKSARWVLRGSTLFFFLDSNTPGWNIPPEQLAMIRETLERKKNTRSIGNIFVFTHQLIWWEPDEPRFGGFAPNSLAWKQGYGASNFREEVVPLFDALPYPVFFIAGDSGAFANGNEIYFAKEGKNTYIAQGVGGSVRDSALEVSVFRNGEVRFDLVALNGDDPRALGRIEEYARSVTQ